MEFNLENITLRYLKSSESVKEAEIAYKDKYREGNYKFSFHKVYEDEWRLDEPLPLHVENNIMTVTTNHEDAYWELFKHLESLTQTKEKEGDKMKFNLDNVEVLDWKADNSIRYCQVLLPEKDGRIVRNVDWFLLQKEDTEWRIKWGLKEETNNMLCSMNELFRGEYLELFDALVAKAECTQERHNIHLTKHRDSTNTCDKYKIYVDNVGHKTITINHERKIVNGLSTLEAVLLGITCKYDDVIRFIGSTSIKPREVTVEDIQKLFTEEIIIKEV